MCYRAFVLQKAQEFGITGFVRNEPDGSVYIEAEGDEEEIKKFIALCSVGHSPANVQSTIREAGEVKKYERFTIA